MHITFLGTIGGQPLGVRPHHSDFRLQAKAILMIVHFVRGGLVEGHVHQDTSQGEEYPAHRQLDRADMTPESIPDAL